jgi:hypothetical protein
MVSNGEDMVGRVLALVYLGSMDINTLAMGKQGLLLWL